MVLLQRMKAAMDTAAFTVMDMATWFEVDHSTMRTWVVEGRRPQRVKQLPLAKALLLLEKTLTKTVTTGLLPIPMSVNQYQRHDYIRKVKEHAIAEFSAPNSSNKGLQMLGLDR